MRENVISENDFNDSVIEWKKMDRSTDAKRKEAINFYDQEIFPIIRELFIDRYKRQNQAVNL